MGMLLGMTQSQPARQARFTSMWQNNYALAEVPIIVDIALLPTAPARPSPLLALALREASAKEADWIWYAKRMLEQEEREYCWQRAAWLTVKRA